MSSDATPTSARRFTICHAINEAIALEMRADPRVFVMGEDVAVFGSVLGNTRGLLAEFGPERVRDTPISETGFVGAAAGAAADGMRPIVELPFVDFIGVCFDAIYNLAAKTCFFSGGRVPIPMVILTFGGGGYGDAGQHSQSLLGTLAHVPGLKVVVPSNAYDAKGLTHSAIRDNNPVVIWGHKALQGMGWLSTEPGSISEVPSEAYTVPLGKAAVVRAGKDITIAGLATTVHYALHAAEELKRDGIDVEVLDLRSLVPLDRETLLASVRKTGRLLVADEDYISYGVTGEIITTVVERAMGSLKCAPQRIAYPDTVIPYSRAMEQFCQPSAKMILERVRAMFRPQEAARA